jgi:hypothetical protein
MTKWHKRNGANDLLAMPRDQRSELAPGVRHRRPERLAMSVDATAIRAAVDDHQRHRDHRGIAPADARCDLLRASNLDVEGPKRLTHVDDLGLRLDHEQGTSVGTPRQQVDRAAVSPDRERHLWPRFPASGEHAFRKPLDKHRVITARKAIQVAGMPAGSVVDTDLEHAGHALQRCLGDRAELPALDSADRRVRHAGPPANVSLPETLAHTDEPEERSEGEGIHGASLAGKAWLAPNRPRRRWPRPISPASGLRRRGSGQGRAAP